MEEAIRIYCLVSEDGYMAAASERSFAGIDWAQILGEGYTDATWCEIEALVPKSKARGFVRQGTHEQEFSDGYEAWSAVRACCAPLDADKCGGGQLKDQVERGLVRKEYTVIDEYARPVNGF